ncbi:MAG TPA: hypothetical protein VFZ60_08840, partial [Nitrososphaeraceae archaeon]
SIDCLIRFVYTFRSNFRFFFTSSTIHFVTNISPNIGKLPMNRYGKMARNIDGSNISILTIQSIQV